MRVARSPALALLVLTTLGVAVSPSHLTYCATKADQASLAAHSKANSFAPHPAAHSRVYGAPIQSRILKSHPKKKPQLTSAPLPDAPPAATRSGG